MVHGNCGKKSDVFMENVETWGKGGSYSDMNLFGEIVLFFRLIGCGVGQFQPILSRSRFY